MTNFKITKFKSKSEQIKPEALFLLEKKKKLFGFIPIGWKKIDTFTSHENVINAIEKLVKNEKTLD